MRGQGMGGHVPLLSKRYMSPFLNQRDTYHRYMSRSGNQRDTYHRYMSRSGSQRDTETNGTRKPTGHGSQRDTETNGTRTVSGETALVPVRSPYDYRKEGIKFAVPVRAVTLDKPER
jgi:hypothetical protein